jgi:hypothetical protein
LVRALFSLPLSTNYNYRTVDPGVMLSARVFNLAVAPTLKNHSRLAFRKRMDAFGLRYNDTGMSVGHHVPRSRNGSNLGINLFAQHAQDNVALGERTATDEELFHYWRLELLSEQHWSKTREYTHRCGVRQDVARRGGVAGARDVDAAEYVERARAGGRALIFFSNTKGTIAIRVAWLMLRRSPMH